MINPDKQVSDMDTVTNVAPSQGRRRLVKGAMLATPAVMTLMSGRLMAAASSTCAQRITDDTELGRVSSAGTTITYVKTGDVVQKKTTPSSGSETIELISYETASTELGIILGPQASIVGCLASF